MEIRIQFRCSEYSICIGRKTNWFAQLHFFTISEIWRDARSEVCYASLLYKIGEK